MIENNEFRDDFLKEMLQSAGTESPSKDFMANIMAQVEAEVVLQEKRKTAPLISPQAWILMAIGFVATICLAILFPSSNSSELPGKAFVDNAIESSTNAFAQLHFPTLLVVAFGMLALFFAMERFFSSRKV